MKQHPFKWWLAVSLLSLTWACKNSSQDNTVTPTNTADVRDSAYYYSLLYYLWNDRLPDYNAFLNSDKILENDKTVFKPRSFASVSDLMSGTNGIPFYSPVGASGKKLDKYSFAASQLDWEATASGSNVGFGFRRGFDANGNLYVASVYAQSPIGLAGVKRGWKIVSVNGVAGTPDNNTAIGQQLSSNNSATFVFSLPDGTQKTLNLTKAAYTANFVLHSSVITLSDQKIGYVVLDSFLGDSSGKKTADLFTQIYNNFKSQGIAGLAIDLRYNGGGYVDLQNAICNLTAPATAKGKTMYTSKYNALLMNYFNQLNSDNNPNNDVNLTVSFDTQPSALNLTKVVFIVTGATASASELLINNLRPYMDVKLVGSQTYGKPTGFPSILIQMSQTDKSKNVYVFPTTFQM
jgi:carboxyl-terminal processing protease